MAKSEKKELPKEEKKKERWVTQQANPHDLKEKIQTLEADGYQIFSIIAVEMGDSDILVIGRLA
jgi:hypothetical protein